VAAGHRHRGTGGGGLRRASGRRERTRADCRSPAYELPCANLGCVTTGLASWLVRLRKYIEMSSVRRLKERHVGQQVHVDRSPTSARIAHPPEGSVYQRGTAQGFRPSMLVALHQRRPFLAGTLSTQGDARLVGDRSTVGLLYDMPLLQTSHREHLIILPQLYHSGGQDAAASGGHIDLASGPRGRDGPMAGRRGRERYKLHLLTH
jgi:hypothetical protein